MPCFFCPLMPFVLAPVASMGLSGPLFFAAPHFLDFPPVWAILFISSPSAPEFKPLSPCPWTMTLIRRLNLVEPFKPPLQRPESPELPNVLFLFRWIRVPLLFSDFLGPPATPPSPPHFGILLIHGFREGPGFSLSTIPVPLKVYADRFFSTPYGDSPSPLSRLTFFCFCPRPRPAPCKTAAAFFFFPSNSFYTLPLPYLPPFGFEVSGEISRSGLFTFFLILPFLGADSDFSTFLRVENKFLAPFPSPLLIVLGPHGFSVSLVIGAPCVAADDFV